MSEQKTERFGKAYVDDAIDAQRKYAEDLFVGAEKRVLAQLEQRLKDLNAQAHPAKQEPLWSQNGAALCELQDALNRLVGEYTLKTGLQVHSVRVKYSGQSVTCTPLVHNRL